MCSYLWRQQECYSDNLIKLPIMSAGIWLQNGSFYKHRYFYDWQKYAQSGANSFTNTYFNNLVTNCLPVQNSKMLKVSAQAIKTNTGHTKISWMLLFCLFHICVASLVSEELTPNKYIHLHLNQVISCIQYSIWDDTCTENTSQVQDTENITDPCLLQTHSVVCSSHSMWSTHFSTICFSSWLPRNLFKTAQAMMYWGSLKKITFLIGNVQD